MASALTPVFNRRVPVTKSNLKGLLSYGIDNLFPQKLTEIVNSSISASICFDVKQKFIEGDGFKNLQLSNMVVHNSGVILDHVLGHTCRNMSVGEVIAVHVSYNALGNKIGMRPVDYEIIRLSEPNELGVIEFAAICPYINSMLYKNRQKWFDLVHLFDDKKEVVLNQIAAAGGIENYKGQLFYAFMPGNGDDFYHIPSYFSGVKAMETDAELVDSDYYSVVNGFNSAGLLAYLRGQKPAGYNPYEDPKSIEYQVQQSLGPDKGGNMFVYGADTPEELANLNFKSFADPKIADRYISTTDRTQVAITKAWKVPNELANIRRQGGLGFSSDELKVASQYMQWNVNKEQRFVKVAFEKLLRNWNGSNKVFDCSIANLNYFNPTNTGATQAGQ